MKFVPTAVSRKAAMAVLHTKKKSPTILFAAGVVGMGATVVTACRATLRVEEVLDEVERKQKLVDQNLAIRDDYDEGDKKHDLLVIRKDMVLDFAKLYALPVGLGVGTLLCFTQAHRIQAKRIAGLSAALAIVTESFEAYRERVRAELGDEKDRHFYYGTEDEIIQEKTENGVKKKTAKKAAGLSGYARWFDEYNVNWQPSPSTNETFLRAHQEYANAKLQCDGYVLLNDIYDALGFERTAAGCVVGWVRKNRGGKDGYVDFGLGEWPTAEDFSLGRERSVLLDFNVDGEVFRLIGPEV